MAIAFYAEDIKLPAIKKRAVGNWVKEVAATYGKKVGDISYIFCSDEKILEVNRQYLLYGYHHVRLYQWRQDLRRPVYQPRHGKD